MLSDRVSEDEVRAPTRPRILALETFQMGKTNVNRQKKFFAKEI